MTCGPGHEPRGISRVVGAFPLELTVLKCPRLSTTPVILEGTELVDETGLFTVHDRITTLVPQSSQNQQDPSSSVCTYFDTYLIRVVIPILVPTILESPRGSGRPSLLGRFSLTTISTRKLLPVLNRLKPVHISPTTSPLTGVRSSVSVPF